jgi:hypothetical protein
VDVINGFDEPLKASVDPAIVKYLLDLLELMSFAF